MLFQPGPWLLVVVLGLVSWQGTALFVRGQTLSLREREFVGAARALGASNWRLMTRHLLPNLLPFIVTLAAIDVGAMILAESSLSFLGLGIAATDAVVGQHADQRRQPDRAVRPGWSGVRAA